MSHYGGESSLQHWSAVHKNTHRRAHTQSVVRDVTSIDLEERQMLPCEHFCLWTSFFIFVTVVHQWSWVQKVSLQKYIVLPFFPREKANFQDWGGDSPPHSPLSFVPDSGVMETLGIIKTWSPILALMPNNAKDLSFQSFCCASCCSNLNLFLNHHCTQIRTDRKNIGTGKDHTGVTYRHR